MKRAQRPIRASRIRTALDIEIARRMGTLNKKPLWKTSDPRIQAMFHPHSERGTAAGYPLSHIEHDLAKLPSENIGNFVDLPTVKRELRQVPGVSTLLKKYPQLEKCFDESVQRAIRERGIKASKFWEKVPKEYIDWIVQNAKARPSQMNQKVGTVIAGMFGKEAKPRTILDIGTFAGGTILGAISRLSPEQKRQLTVVLVDVNERVVKGHAVPELVAQGIPRQNIQVISASFYAAAVAFKQMPKPFHERGRPGFEKEFRALAGKVNAIVAGAATINFANDLTPFFKSIRTLLKPNGAFVDWEWGSAETKSPIVNIPELKKEIIAHQLMGENKYQRKGVPVTAFDAYVSFLNFWMGSFKYPESVRKKLFTDIEESGGEFNFFDWCRQHRDWMESKREKSGEKRVPEPAGFRNRAYREGKLMISAAQQHGFRTKRAVYPLAKPGQLDTGNVNYLVVARKE